MRTDGPLEHIVARNDVIYDAYWRDGDSVADLRHVFRIHRNYIGQIVFCRPGHPLSNRQQRSADG